MKDRNENLSMWFYLRKPPVEQHDIYIVLIKLFIKNFSISIWLTNCFHSYLVVTDEQWKELHIGSELILNDIVIGIN